MGAHTIDADAVRGLTFQSEQFVFCKRKTAYEMLRSLVGSEMCIRDRTGDGHTHRTVVTSLPAFRAGRHMAVPALHAPNAALLIDFDNVTLGVRSDLPKELRTLLNSDILKGKVAVQRLSLIHI